MIKYLKVAGKVLTILGVAFDAVFLIYEIVDVAKQRAEFQKYVWSYINSFYNSNLHSQSNQGSVCSSLFCKENSTIYSGNSIICE